MSWLGTFCNGWNCCGSAGGGGGGGGMVFFSVGLIFQVSVCAGLLGI